MYTAAVASRLRYPLQGLLRLREEIRGQREVELAGATRALEAAEATLREARQEHQARLERVERRRALAFQQGGGAVAHRVEALRFVERLEAEARQAETVVRDAAEARQAAEAACGEARDALARAEVELKVVKSNRDAWDESRRKEALERAEAELEDITAARRRK